MSQLKANCPSCAAPIEFKAGSTIVAICPFCRSAVARTDRKLEDLGKVAEIIPSSSPLKLGIQGEFNGNKFELTGRAQIKHGAGGFWDEWYATFSNGWVGWLAEAQGKFYMTFYKPLAEGVEIPSFQELKVGQKLEGLSDETHLIVNEKGEATYIAADGEIPYQLNPNEKSNYVDLSGKDGVFATIDYSTNPPYLFYGQELTLKDLGLVNALPAEKETKSVPVESGNCPNCGGAIELKLPDKSERVTCSFCNSLLDVNNNKLEFLKTLKKSPLTKDFDLLIGAKGSFKNFADGAEFEVVGAMLRSVKYDISYFWDEYLLYNPKIGFRWLVCSQNHWSFVESVSTGDILSSDDTVDLGTDLTSNLYDLSYKDEDFSPFASAKAKVEYVKGEFYWRVEQGETVKMTDYVSPPFMLSKEIAKDEMNWSYGTYLEKRDLEKAFGISGLPEPYSISPNQPYKYNSLIRNSLIFLVVFLLLAIIFSTFDSEKDSKPASTDLSELITIPARDTADSEVEVYSSSFYLEEGESVDIDVETLLTFENKIDFKVKLVPADAKTNKNSAKVKIEKIGKYFDEKLKKNVESIDKPSSPNIVIRNYYETAEAEISKYERVDESGQYQLQIKGTWKNWEQPFFLTVKVDQYVGQDYSGTYKFLLLLFLFALVPVVMILNKWNFETMRWQESDFPENGEAMTRTISGIFSGK